MNFILVKKKKTDFNINVKNIKKNTTRIILFITKKNIKNTEIITPII